MLHNTIFLYFPKQNMLLSMSILSQTLKSHNSETVFPFELKFVVEIYFGQLYQRSIREVSEIDQSIAIDMLSMPGLEGTNGYTIYYYRHFELISVRYNSCRRQEQKTLYFLHPPNLSFRKKI
jgi:hypothetical protein